MAVAAAPIELAQISLRHPDRGLVVGGSGSGKSTLMDMLGSDFMARYEARGARRLILDSKPRYKADRLTNGLPARRLYKNWDHGQHIPGSYLAVDPDDMDNAFRLGARTVIVQTQRDTEIPRLVRCARRFLNGARAGRPQLLQVDELLDFFHANGMPRGGDDAIPRTARAGRELGTSFLGGTQRTHGISMILMSELRRLYGFRMDAKTDNKRLLEMGAPEDILTLPDTEYLFMYWQKFQTYRRIFGPYKLAIPKQRKGVQ